MLGHIYANRIENPDLKPPYLALVVSGGHTELVDFKSIDDFDIIGRTRDDAAGEAFDKVSKLLGLGYPGGPMIDNIARKGDPKFHQFPRALNKKDNYDFSFSGFKTSVRNYLASKEYDFINDHIADISASVQQAIVDSLVSKTIAYAKHSNAEKIIVAGGVSANSLLRKEISEKGKVIGVNVFFPALEYCMDNAAMIGAAAIEKYQNNEFADLTLNAFSTKGIRII
jgi:N6-L-threonylcarbamoyladenine synthase